MRDLIWLDMLLVLALTVPVWLRLRAWLPWRGEPNSTPPEVWNSAPWPWGLQRGCRTDELCDHRLCAESHLKGGSDV